MLRYNLKLFATNKNFLLRSPFLLNVYKPGFILSNQKQKLHTTCILKQQQHVFTNEELVAAKAARLNSLGPLISKLPEKWIPYAELMRLDKPVGTWLLYLPCTWSIIMGAILTHAPLIPTITTLSLFGIGALIMRGAGCTINDYWDRKLDKSVLRSLERPLASGRVSKRNALTFFTLQNLLGGLVLWQLPHDCLLLGISSLPIVIAYPLFKRITYYPQAILSLCFNWGALLGFPAMGIINWSIMLPLYAGSYLWCMIYDTIYAHQDKKFDIKTGIKSTALAWGSNTKLISNTLALGQIGFFTLAGINSGLIMGPGFVLGLSIFSYRLFNMIRRVNLDDPENCGYHFKSNIKTGLYFTGSLFLDYMLHLLGIL